MTFRHPRILGILVSILFTLLLIDGCLYWIDPLGIVDATHSNHAFHEAMLPDSTGYILQAGTHRFHAYTAAILTDGSRAVPATNNEAKCTIAAIGDSMTFGQGVDDTDTWVNLLAVQYPDVRFVNTARPDYSAPNVVRLKAAYPADGYIWLLIYNDALEPFTSFGKPPYPYPMATALYRAWIFNRLRGAVSREARRIDVRGYWQAVEQIAGDNVQIAGFVNDALTMNTALRYPVVLIPPYTGFVSSVDTHPNTEGHRQIADSLLPYLTPFIDMVCNAKN